MNDSTRKKVVSLADKRRERLPLIGFKSNLDGPINGSFYDLWVETDGSMMIRIDAGKATFAKNGLRFGKEDEEPFKARGEAYEVRVAPLDIDRFMRDVMHTAHASRRRAEFQRGDHLWRCTPNADGSYDVEHAQTKATFEPFSPRMRKGFVADGPLTSGVQRGHTGAVAPKCSACRRFVQMGETMYRERRQPSRWGGFEYRKFGGSELCSTCISNAPRQGITG